MNPPADFSGGGADNRPSPRKELQLQGPRPTALKVNDSSHKIKKPPIARRSLRNLPHAGRPPVFEERKPVVIYTVSPKIIHTTASEYKRLVQRLTGCEPDGACASPPRVGDLSPAARIASIEHTSPSKERETAKNGGADVSLATDDLLADMNAELGHAPGILSPAPCTLPPISASFFPTDQDYLPASWSSGFFPPTTEYLPASSSGFFPPSSTEYLPASSTGFFPPTTEYLPASSSGFFPPTSTEYLPASPTGFFPPSSTEYLPASPTGFFPPTTEYLSPSMGPGFPSPGPGFFSPGGDPFMMGLSNMFAPSPSAPSTLFTPTKVSPSRSSYSYDLFGPSFDF